MTPDAKIEAMKRDIIDILKTNGPSSMDSLVVNLFGGSLCSAGQVDFLRAALGELESQGRISRNILFYELTGDL